jgi:hypothetical protein
MNHRTIYSLLALCLLVMSFSACTGKKSAKTYNGPAGNWTGEVEHAPGQWLPLEGESGRAWFRCQWNGKTVYWPGNYRKAKSGGYIGGYYDTQIQLSLRSFEGRLFLIYHDLDAAGYNGQFVYCELDSSGTRFQVIPKKEFPRQIATQNFGLDSEGFARYKDGNVVNFPKIIRNLEVDDIFFPNTNTGKIWYDLETGDRSRWSVDGPVKAAEFCRDFVRKYQPIALLTIDKSL